MSEPRVICLGEILFDCIADHTSNSWSEVTSWTPYPGGAIANVACALVKLGTPAAYIGCVGVDALGDELQQLLRKVGVDSSGVVVHPTAPTRQVQVLRAADGDRSFAGFSEASPGVFADAHLKPQDLPENLFIQAEFLVLGTLELAYPETRSAIWRALELAGYYNMKVIVDINWRPMFWTDESEALPLIKKLLSGVDFLKLAAEEAEWLFETRDAGAIAHRLGTVEGVLVTDGGADVSYCLSDNEGKVQPPVMQIVDTTGAGDSFLAGFIHQLCQQGISSLTNPVTAREIVEYATLVGSLTTTKLGAINAQPTAREVEKFRSEEIC